MGKTRKVRRLKRMRGGNSGTRLKKIVDVKKITTLSKPAFAKNTTTLNTSPKIEVEKQTNQEYNVTPFSEPLRIVEISSSPTPSRSRSSSVQGQPENTLSKKPGNKPINISEFVGLTENKENEEKKIYGRLIPSISRKPTQNKIDVPTNLPQESNAFRSIPNNQTKKLSFFNRLFKTTKKNPFTQKPINQEHMTNSKTNNQKPLTNEQKKRSRPERVKLLQQNPTSTRKNRKRNTNNRRTNRVRA